MAATGNTKRGIDAIGSTADAAAGAAPGDALSTVIALLKQIVLNTNPA